MFESFLDEHGDAIRMEHIKLEYDGTSCRIIVYGPPIPYHDCTPVFLQKVLIGLQGTAFDTPARQDTLSVREIAFRSRDRSFIMPDAAVVVIDDEAPPRLWPTIVVEVANTQSYENAVGKIQRWFVKSRNTVEVGLLVKFVAKNPLLDPSCFLEVYRGRLVDADAGGDSLEFETESDSSDDEELEEDEELEDDDLDDLSDYNTDRSASPDEQPPVETTFLLPVDTHADAVTEDKSEDSLQNQVDSDSSLSSLEDEEPDLEDPPAAIPDQVDSDSSLSSVDDEELDLDELLTAPPIPAKQRLQVYIADTRKIVLPVSDPPDPEMRYLTLRYSDFFGSENVPVGKDPAEEVRLDLDILRREVRNLVRLTVRQVGSLKRSAKGGGGAAGKRGRR